MSSVSDKAYGAVIPWTGGWSSLCDVLASFIRLRLCLCLTLPCLLCYIFRSLCMPEFPATGMGATYIERFNCFIRTSFFLSSFRSPWFLITVLWFWVRFLWTPMLLPRIRLRSRPRFLLADGSSAFKKSQTSITAPKPSKNRNLSKTLYLQGSNPRPRRCSGCYCFATPSSTAHRLDFGPLSRSWFGQTAVLLCGFH